MKKIILIILVLVGASVIYWFQFRHNNVTELPRQQALTVGKHSPAFNNTIDSLMQSYFQIKNALVDADSANTKAAGNAFFSFLNRINLDELKKDTSGIFETATAFLNDVKANAEN